MEPRRHADAAGVHLVFVLLGKLSYPKWGEAVTE
jgi:hypothetical protein